MYLETFKLPIAKEKRMISERMAYNGGPYGYIDNIYPFTFSAGVTRS